jgi:hypothetical protein
LKLCIFPRRAKGDKKNITKGKNLTNKEYHIYSTGTNNCSPKLASKLLYQK